MYWLCREELFQIVTQLKKQQRTDESLIANLKAENQRLLIKPHTGISRDYFSTDWKMSL